MPVAIHLTPDQVAERLQLSKQTLANMRHLGRGPRYLKIGSRVRYPLNELERWEEMNSRQNTAGEG